MMKSLRSSLVLRSTLLALALLVLGYSVAGACLFPRPRLVVKCDEQVIYSSYSLNSLEDGNSRAMLEKRDAIYKEAVANATLCKGDFEGIEEAFKQNIVEWAETRNLSSFWGDELLVEPYTQAKETQVSMSQNNLLSCLYFTSEKAGEWLFITAHAREYCRNTGTCYHKKTVSYPYFFLYLINNLSPLTFTYLFVYVAAFGITIAFWLFLLKSLKLQPSLGKLGVDLLIISPLYLFFATFLVSNWGEQLGWLMMTYIAASFIQLLLSLFRFAQISSLAHYFRKPN
jgi:hypothetical protein